MNTIARALGSQVGNGVFNDMSIFGDYSLITIGNYSCFSRSEIWAHSFHRGQMDFFPVVVDDYVTMKPGSFLFSSTMQDDVTLLSGASPLRGEVFTSGKTFIGAPAKLLMQI